MLGLGLGFRFGSKPGLGGLARRGKGGEAGSPPFGANGVAAGFRQMEISLRTGDTNLILR